MYLLKVFPPNTTIAPHHVTSVTPVTLHIEHWLSTSYAITHSKIETKSQAKPPKKERKHTLITLKMSKLHVKITKTRHVKFVNSTR